VHRPDGWATVTSPPKPAEIVRARLRNRLVKGTLQTVGMHLLLAILALSGGTIASIYWTQLARRSRRRRFEVDREVQAAELRREAENAELVLQRLEALQRKTGFNVAASKLEAQKVLAQLRGEPPEGGR
jgi:hypothetical protein